MSDKLERLKGLLRELFQLDQPDLDFGIYRIMHAKSAEVTQFLDNELLPQVREAFEQYQPASKAEVKKELDELVASVEKAGMDPEQSPKVQELKTKLADEAVDLDALEAEVYDHLYHFFRRYYSEGDFLAKRVYKPGVYAVPYEGEEVKLHWANKDQYYIKTTENLRDYAFKLRPHDARDPMRVHFRLVDAAEGEHGNVKATNERRFILAPGGESGREFLAIEEGELVIRFEYRPATLSDWPEERRADEEAKDKPKPPVQADLTTLIAERLLALDDDELAAWLAELSKVHVKADGTQADYNRLIGHLNRYTALHQFDYFIHKDLGGFLRRELGFFIKNEIMHLDDVESETAPRVEQYLSKIRVIRTIAHKVIDFLAQLETFQKTLWLKKKFVIETNYCLTLDHILSMGDDEADTDRKESRTRERDWLLQQIAANDAQRCEWVRLFAIDEITSDNLGEEGFSEPLTITFLRQQPTLILDTKFFNSEFRERLLAALEDIDHTLDGILIHGENHHALRLLGRRYASQVKAVYVDPPYNTKKDIFPFKDGYKDASWLAMMNDRLLACAPLLRNDGVFFSSIDWNELYHLNLLMCEIFGGANRVGDVVWHNARDNNPTRIATEHEFILCYARRLGATEQVWKNEFADAKEILLAEHDRLRDEGLAPGEIQARIRQFIKDNKEVLAEVDRYKFVDDEGVYTGSQSVHNPHPNGYEYDVIHPDTGRPMRLPANGYRFPEETMRRQYIERDRLIYGPDENRIVQIKLYLKEYQDSLRSVIGLDGRLGAYALSALFGEASVFDNPKPPQLLRRLLSFASVPESVVLDYFAGSGTTVQAVLEVARMTNVRMRYVAIEMAEYFDTVMLPRVLKVIYSSSWKQGKPKKRDGGSHGLKYIRLESYEDALNNLLIRRDEQQRSLLGAAEAEELREQFMLRYMLDVETRGSPSLLNLETFSDPTAYMLNLKQPRGDESREINVDLLETFNWLIGLTVQHIAAPQTLTAGFERNEEGRLQINDRLRPAIDGLWWFRTVTGTTPDGKKTMIIWRKRPGGDTAEGLEQDNLVLNEWFSKSGYSTKDYEFDLIYVNGDNNLENLKTPEDTWKVRLIEEDFHRLMFEDTD